jgi:hypothetical protein
MKIRKRLFIAKGTELRGLKSSRISGRPAD